MIGVSEWVSMHLLNLESWKVETLVFFCEMSNGPFEISLDSRRPMNSQQQLSDTGTVKKGVKLWLCLRSAMCNVSHHAHESSQLIIPVNLCCLCCSAHKQSISIFIFTFRIGYIFCFLLFSFEVLKKLWVKCYCFDELVRTAQMVKRRPNLEHFFSNLLFHFVWWKSLELREARTTTGEKMSGDWSHTRSVLVYYEVERRNQSVVIAPWSFFRTLIGVFPVWLLNLFRSFLFLLSKTQLA